MAILIFKQIAIHFLAKLLHKLQPACGTFSQPKKNYFFWLILLTINSCNTDMMQKLIRKKSTNLITPNRHGQLSSFTGCKVMGNPHLAGTFVHLVAAQEVSKSHKNFCIKKAELAHKFTTYGNGFN